MEKIEKKLRNVQSMYKEKAIRITERYTATQQKSRSTDQDNMFRLFSKYSGLDYLKIKTDIC